MKLVVGLGNPGKEYEKTRHNVGFIVLDNYLGEVNWKKKFNAMYYISNDVCFVKPLTYMNDSGRAVIEFVKYYDIDIKDILVIQDDLDMNSGSFKLKMNSSCGGHNGIRSIINHLNSDAFLRLKIGILNQYKDDNVIDFVLGKLSKEEIEFLQDNKFKDIIDLFIKDGNKIVNSYKQ